MKTNLYLVRHAHSRYTPDELNRPLSEKGLKDAERVTESLFHEKITHVVASPYKRAVQTVEGVAKASKVSIYIDKGFMERKLAGGSVDNFDEAVLKAWEDFSFSLPGGESGYCAQSRGVEALKYTIEKFQGGNIAIGTHGNIMVLIMNYYDQRYDYRFWRNLRMPDIYKLTFCNENLTEVKSLW